MKGDIEFIALDQVRKQIGAPLINISFAQAKLKNLEAIEAQLQQGVELTLDKVQTRNGLFVHEGLHIVIYIPDHTFTTAGKSYDAIKNRRRVHLYECQTIKGMKAASKYDRYIATTRRDNLYPIETIKGKKDVSLWPCKNCLDVLDYQGYTQTYQQNKIRENFDIEEFFGQYTTFFSEKPQHSDRTFPPNDYVKNWSKISRAQKKIKNWTCEDCRINLSSHTKYLHTHHINGNKWDNNHHTNLLVLCIVCHAKQPYHGHMQANAQKAQKFIEDLRREQGFAIKTAE